MDPQPDTAALFEDPLALRRHIQKSIYLKTARTPRLYGEETGDREPSSVLFLLGLHPSKDGLPPQPGLILNKRSPKVRQPGDLCFPGGSPSPQRDTFIARLLGLPFSPLTRWPYWLTWCRRHPVDSSRIPMLLATSLRESYEEMRLKPLRVQFMGPLPPQRLVMFKRVIYPMAAWTSGQKTFHPNWEVEKIVFICLRSLLDPAGYGRHRLTVSEPLSGTLTDQPRDYPCFVHEENGQREILWGATYRIVMGFLDWVFDFHPPPMDALPLHERPLEDHYMTGTSE
jgi:hypothetical protein